jgi:light-regulated signal transduction histidine kinase (bacteriophytochrome)
MRSLEMKIDESNAVIHVAPMPTVWAWPGRIDQVFQNLIQNAIKYRKPDVPPEIHVKATEHAAEWVFAVQDNGIGFDQKNAQKIFSLFKQLHPRGEYEGMGMGLAIVKRIVERHGGQVCAETAPGIGSSFYFSLPKVDGRPPGSSETNREAA